MDGLCLGCGVVHDGGVAPSELMAHATTKLDYDLALTVTASHNPTPYNGVKAMGRVAQALHRDLCLALDEKLDAVLGEYGTRVFAEHEVVGAPLDDLIETWRPRAVRLPPFRVLAHGLNGCAPTLNGPLMETLEMTWLGDAMNGDFPFDGPDPSQPEFVREFGDWMRQGSYDLGLAWDGDADRCVFFRPDGLTLGTPLIQALLAERLLRDVEGGVVLRDPKIYWLLEKVVQEQGGRVHPCPTGHVHFRRAMVEQGAVYGGESSGHHFFSQTMGSDSGVLPWIMILEGLAEGHLWSRVGELEEGYAFLPETNLKVDDAAAFMEGMEARFAPVAESMSREDGLSLAFEDWRFNLRPSNTEPLLRLNLEGWGSLESVEEHKRDIIGT